MTIMADKELCEYIPLLKERFTIIFPKINIDKPYIASSVYKNGDYWVTFSKRIKVNGISIRLTTKCYKSTKHSIPDKTIVAYVRIMSGKDNGKIHHVTSVEDWVSFLKDKLDKSKSLL
jgi:hypothetical protein